MNTHLKQILNGVLITFWMFIYWILIGVIPKCFPYFYENYHDELFHSTVALSILVFFILLYIYYSRKNQPKTLLFLVLLILPYCFFLIILIVIASNLPRITDLFFIALGFGIMSIMELKNSSNKQKIIIFIISCLLIIPSYYFIYDNIWYCANKSKLNESKSLGDFNFKITNKKGDCFNLAELKGKTVCIDMWASSCGNCISAMPDFEKLNLSFGNDTNYKIVSLFCPIKKEQTYEWFQDYINKKFHYDIDYYYIDFETFQKLNIRKFPEFLIISKKNNLVYRGQISYLPYVKDNIYNKLKSINENY